MHAAAKHDAGNHLIPLLPRPVFGKRKMRVCLCPRIHSLLVFPLRQIRCSLLGALMPEYAIAYFHVSATTKNTLEK
jgi:hypothetical protein